MSAVNVLNAADVAKGTRAAIPAEPGPSTVRRSACLSQLAGAMAKAQAELKNPTKDSVNPHFKSRYADLATVRDVVVPVLVRNGLVVVQFPCDCDDVPALTTLVVHTSGEWVETTMKTRPLKLDPQAVGSALTYARRYSLQSIAGVAADDDDDGNAASQSPRQERREDPPRGVAAADFARLMSRFASVDRAGWKTLVADVQEAWESMTEDQQNRVNGATEDAKARIKAQPAGGK